MIELMLETLKQCEEQLRDYVEFMHKNDGGCSLDMESAWMAAKDTIKQAENYLSVKKIEEENFKKEHNEKSRRN